MTEHACLGDCRTLARIDEVSNAGAWSENAFYESVMNPSYAVIVYRDEEGEEPAGFIVCEFQGDLLAIDEIAVLPARRRCGIASALLNVAAAEGIRRNCKEITLEVRSGNAAAIAFYDNVGFQAAGVRKGLYKDPPDDAIVMMKKLTQ